MALWRPETETQVPQLARCFATAVSTPGASSSRRKALDDGLSLGDFVSGDIPAPGERVVLGNTTQ